MAENFEKPKETLSELEKDAANLLFALHDAWPYVHQWCTIESRKKSIQALIVKHGDFADIHKARKKSPEQSDQIQQIAEALRKHGLTLVKTAAGYDVVKLGEITAQPQKKSPERSDQTRRTGAAALAPPGYFKSEQQEPRLTGLMLDDWRKAEQPKNIRVHGWVWKDKQTEDDCYIPSYTPAQHVPRGELLALVDPADLHEPLQNTKWF